MNKIKKIVQRLLEQQPALRDNDNALMVTIWKGETSVIDFFYSFENGYLTSPETIRRSRQKLQQENVELRGLSYEARQKLQIKIKSELGYL